MAITKPAVGQAGWSSAVDAVIDAVNAGSRSVRVDLTSGNLTVGSTTWANLSTSLDLVLTAEAGQKIEVGLSAYVTSAASNWLYLDAVTVVSGSPVNSITTRGPAPSPFGAPGWAAPPGAAQAMSGSLTYILQAGDISGGQVRIRWRYKSDTATPTRLMYALSASWPLTAWARLIRAGNPAIQPVGWWEELFLRTWDSDHTGTFLALSTSANSWSHYNLAFAIDANNAMYRATGGLKYLDRALLYANNIITSSVLPSTLTSPNNSWKTDSYLSWAAYGHPDPTVVDGQQYPLFESFAWRYITETLRIIRQTPSLWANSTYNSQYATILAFVETNMWDKWYLRPVESGAANTLNWHMYRSATNMTSIWAFIAMSLSVLTADTTRQTNCQTVYANINSAGMPAYPGQSLRNQLQPNPTIPAAYVWDWAWGPYTGVGDPNVQDFVHCSEISYIVEAFDRGSYWTQADIVAFSHTLTDVAWANYPTSFPTNVDGTGTTLGGILMDGFIKMGRYSPAIQLKLETYPTAILSTLDPAHVASHYGNGALNARIIGATPLAQFFLA